MSTHPATKPGADKFSKFRTNIYLSPETKELAKAVLKTTGYKTLSGFVDAHLAKFFRKNARKLRASGHQLPERLFLRDFTA